MTAGERAARPETKYIGNLTEIPLDLRNRLEAAFWSGRRSIEVSAADYAALCAVRRNSLEAIGSSEPEPNKLIYKLRLEVLCSELETKWWQGPVVCSLCGHHYRAVIEIPADQHEPIVPMECSACGNMTVEVDGA